MAGVFAFSAPFLNRPGGVPGGKGVGRQTGQGQDGLDDFRKRGKLKIWEEKGGLVSGIMRTCRVLKKKKTAANPRAEKQKRCPAGASAATEKIF